jgi:hypothetical protein
MKKVAIALAILAAGAPSYAATYFDTGNDYWGRCAGKDNVICTATAAAYLDMMESLGYKCSTAGVSRTQAKDVFLKYLADNPEQRNHPAATLGTAAFMNAFGCKL